MKKPPKIKSVKFIGTFSGTPLKKNEAIFTVVSIQSENTGWGFGDTLLQGWFLTKKEAEHAVEINAGDLQQTCYDYVVIEKLPSGIPAPAESVAWYKWTGNYPDVIWESCKKPW